MNSDISLGAMVLLVITFSMAVGSVTSTLVTLGVPMDEVGQDLSNFPTRQDLLVFLETDTTELNLYTDEYDCKDFARDLKRNAWASGYRIRIYLIIGDKALTEYDRLLHQSTNSFMDSEGGFGHALCKAYILDEDLWVTIEPQGDLILNCTISNW